MVDTNWAMLFEIFWEKQKNGSCQPQNSPNLFNLKIKTNMLTRENARNLRRN
jgi:hypothetical protein